MNDETINEEKSNDTNNKKEPKNVKRQIIIETDGNNIDIIKNETAGLLELQAVLGVILNKLTNTK